MSKENFLSIPNSILSRTDLSDADKITLCCIISWLVDGKECFIGNEYLSKRLGISKNAASIRIKRLEKIGCISLRYTYKEGTKEVDKRYITLLSIEPKVSSFTREVSSFTREGIVSETKGYRPTDDEVSCKQGSIISVDYINYKINGLDKLLHQGLDNEKSLEEQLEHINLLISEDKFKTGDERGAAYFEKYRLEKLIKDKITPI